MSNSPESPNKKVELPSFEYLMSPLKKLLAELELAVGKLSLEIQLNFWQKVKAEIDLKFEKVQGKVDDERKAETAIKNAKLIREFQKQFPIKSSADLIAEMRNPKFIEYLKDENRKVRVIAYLCEILNEEFGETVVFPQSGLIKDVRYDAKLSLNDRNINPLSSEDWQDRNVKINQFFVKAKQSPNFKVLFFQN